MIPLLQMVCPMVSVLITCHVKTLILCAQVASVSATAGLETSTVNVVKVIHFYTL